MPHLIPIWLEPHCSHIWFHFDWHLIRLLLLCFVFPENLISFDWHLFLCFYCVLFFLRIRFHLICICSSVPIISCFSWECTLSWRNCTCMWPPELRKREEFNRRSVKEENEWVALASVAWTACKVQLNSDDFIFENRFYFREFSPQDVWATGDCSLINTFSSYSLLYYLILIMRHQSNGLFFFQIFLLKHCWFTMLC